MPVKFEWDLDPSSGGGGGGGGGGGDLQSCLLELSQSNGFYCGEDEDNDSKYHESYMDEFESDFYGSTAPLPNDDIWKKFDILDDCEDFDEELSNMFDLTNVAWSSPMQCMTTQATSSPLSGKDSREIRNHDCMWAGHCISEKHDRNDRKNQRCGNLMPIKKTPPPPVEESAAVAAAVVPEGTASRERVCVRKNAVVAPTHARSLLLPTRIVNATAKKPVGPRCGAGTPTRTGRLKTLDSEGESPRPETPQSLTDNEDLNLDLPDMKTVEDFVVDTFGYNFVNDLVNNVASGCDDEDDDDNSEKSDELGSYLLDRGEATTATPSKATPQTSPQQNKVNRTISKQEMPISRHYTTYNFFSDHCYHLSKNARMDNLGVQTPSDSEEEIDVETVYGDSKKSNGRGSSGGAVLPTNPSPADRQQLQLTVASAISKKDGKKQSARIAASVPARYSLDDRTLKTKIMPCKRKLNVRTEVRRTGGGVGLGGSGTNNKRSAHQFEDYSDYVSNGKSVKRKKYQRHLKATKSKKAKSRRASARAFAGGTSDSEADSMERRTIHNSMERQRRIDLRNAFEELRKLIPYTAGNEKAAKVVILNSGAEFCKTLTNEDSELTRKKADLRRQQEMLMARVSQLRRSLAAQR